MQQNQFWLRTKKRESETSLSRLYMFSWLSTDIDCCRVGKEEMKITSRRNNLLTGPVQICQKIGRLRYPYQAPHFLFPSPSSYKLALRERRFVSNEKNILIGNFSAAIYALPWISSFSLQTDTFLMKLR